jgi:hypothetical protein
MKHLRGLYIALCVALSVAAVSFTADAACAAQAVSSSPQAPEEKAKTPKGVVTGTVYCADTNLPARVAQIMLVPTAQQNFSPQNIATTDLDGRFSLPKVPEGSYYIAAILPGYLNLLANMSESHLKAMSPEVRKEFEARVTVVTVSAKQAAEVSLRLERGAEIDGTVLYDDGSPAIALQVEFKPKSSTAKPGLPEDGSFFSVMSFLDRAQRSTDDHGRFRILGVAPGEYLVSVTVPTSSATDSGPNVFTRMIESTSIGGLIVYAGGTVRASKAKVIKVGAGETNRDADIIIPLSTLHSVHGYVTLKSTGLPPPTATLQLFYADTREPVRTAIAQNGEFEMSYVPEDSFVLRAMASAQAMPNFDPEDGGDSGMGFFFNSDQSSTKDDKIPEGAVEVPLQVKSDVESMTIAVPDPPAKEASQPAPDQSNSQVVAVPQ